MSQVKKHYLKLLLRIFNLLFIRKSDCNSLVTKSYNRISNDYDATWTNHMRDLTASLIDKIEPGEDSSCIDLTCGTGYATNLIYEKTKGKVTGVDKSKGMLNEARKKFGENCEFVQEDVINFLKNQPAESIDIITCCWGLGYSKPFTVLKQIKRILKPSGRVGIIDNSLFSLKEIIYCSFLTFAEFPEKMENLMRFRFLPNSKMLGIFFRILGFKPYYLNDGSRSYKADSGEKAIQKLRDTGAAAGFEYACSKEDQKEVFKRFAEIIEEKYMTRDSIEVTHRYFAGIAKK